jgi:hypothetical protein
MPQVADRGFLKRYDDVPGVGRDIEVVTTGVKLDGAPVSVDARRPNWGRTTPRSGARWASRPMRSSASGGGGRDMSGEGRGCLRLVEHRDHRHGAGPIRLRGHPIEELIGRVSFPQMIWLMTRGDLPTEAQARLLEARWSPRWITGRRRPPSPPRAWR